MKSYGQLWERVASPENLAAALRRVMKGRGAKRDVAAFAARAGDELAALRAELLSGAWRPGPYGQFRVTDPKPRTISCAPVRDRVAHHALCGVIAPLLERVFTEDCYACRVGKGTHRAAARARELVRRHGWTCKLDIRRYFDSVPHDRLVELLLPIFQAGLKTKKRKEPNDDNDERNDDRVCSGGAVGGAGGRGGERGVERRAAGHARDQRRGGCGGAGAGHAQLHDRLVGGAAAQHQEDHRHGDPDPMK